MKKLFLFLSCLVLVSYRTIGQPARTVTVNTNGQVIAPPNFWPANSNALNAVVAAIGGGVTNGGNGIVVIGTTAHFAQSSAYTNGLVPYVSGTNSIGFAPALFYDQTTDRLTIGDQLGGLSALHIGKTGLTGSSSGITLGTGFERNQLYSDGNGNLVLQFGGGVGINSPSFIVQGLVGGSPFTLLRSRGSVLELNTQVRPLISGPGILLRTDSNTNLSAVTIGSGVAFDGTTLSATGSGGTVTSVGLSLPSQFNVSGSPVTGSGTLTGAWANQSSNTFLAGPVDNGAAAAPTFRALSVSDFNSGSSASSSTFWRGDGTWATPAGGISGSGTTGKIPFWLNSSTLASSVISTNLNGITVGGTILTDDGSLANPALGFTVQKSGFYRGGDHSLTVGIAGTAEVASFGDGTSGSYGGLSAKALRATNSIDLVTGAGNGKVLTSDAFGVGSWATAPTASLTPWTSDVNAAGFKLIGNTTTTGDLTLQTTSGVGATGADMHFLVGNNGATEAMTILNNGNVGIGTTSPTYNFEVKSSTAGIAIDAPNQRIGTTFGTGGALGLFAESPGSTNGAYAILGGSSRSDSLKNAFTVGTNNVEAFRVDGNYSGHTFGNVGIGTSTPGVKLDLSGDLGANAAFRMRNTGSPSGANQAVVDVGFSDSQRLTFGSAGATLGSPYNNKGYFLSQGNTAGIDFMTSSSSQPIAISPNQVTTLSVMPNAATLTGSLVVSPDNTYDIGASGATRPRSVYAGTSFLAPNGSASVTGFGFTSAANYGMYYDASASDLVFSRNGAGVFRLAFGEVRIGTGLFAAGSSVTTSDTYLARESAAVWQLGLDAASPVAQTLKGADARAGTDSNTAGGNMTIAAGRSTGSGVGGTLRFQTADQTATTTTANVLGDGATLTAGNQRKFSVQSGTNATMVGVGGTLKVDTTSTGNVGGGEDTLITYTIPANVLGTTGDFIEFDCWGTFAANANTKDLKIIYGGTTLYDSTALVFNGVDWRGHGKIVRTGAATQTATCEFTIGGTLLGAVTTTTATTSAPAETLSGTVVFKVTGTDSGVTPVDNSIVQKSMVLKWYPNN